MSFPTPETVPKLTVALVRSGLAKPLVAISNPKGSPVIFACRNLRRFRDEVSDNSKNDVKLWSSCVRLMLLLRHGAPRAFEPQYERNRASARTSRVGIVSIADAPFQIRLGNLADWVGWVAPPVAFAWSLKE